MQLGFPHRLIFRMWATRKLGQYYSYQTLALCVIFRKPCDCLTFIYESTERSPVYFPVCLVRRGFYFSFFGWVTEISGLFLKGEVRLNQETLQAACLGSQQSKAHAAVSKPNQTGAQRGYEIAKQ